MSSDWSGAVRFCAGCVLHATAVSPIGVSYLTLARIIVVHPRRYLIRWSTSEFSRFLLPGDDDSDHSSCTHRSLSDNDQIRQKVF